MSILPIFSCLNHNPSCFVVNCFFFTYSHHFYASICSVMKCNYCITRIRNWMCTSCSNLDIHSTFLNSGISCSCTLLSNHFCIPIWIYSTFKLLSFEDLRDLNGYFYCFFHHYNIQCKHSGTSKSFLGKNTSNTFLRIWFSCSGKFSALISWL